jgi:hypothetical protein
MPMQGYKPEQILTMLREVEGASRTDPRLIHSLRQLSRTSQKIRSAEHSRYHRGANR